MLARLKEAFRMLLDKKKKKPLIDSLAVLERRAVSLSPIKLTADFRVENVRHCARRRKKREKETSKELVAAITL